VQKNGQLGLHDAVTQFDRGLSDVIDGADDVFHQLIEFIRAAVVENPSIPIAFSLSQRGERCRPLTRLTFSFYVLS